MKNLCSNHVTVNYPPVGYHTLKLLDGLRRTYWETDKEIKSVQKLTRPMGYEKNRRIQKLRSYQKQIEADFEFWSGLVKEWVSQFPDKDALYGDIVVEYYCDINNTLSLQNIIEEILCDDDDRNKKASQFQAKIRQITLIQIQKN